MLIQACQGEATGSELRRTTQPEEGSESETDAASVSQTSLEKSSTTEQTQSNPQPHDAKGAEGHQTNSKAGEACSLYPDPARPTQTADTEYHSTETTHSASLVRSYWRTSLQGSVYRSYR